jgi:hypothetical protein
MKSRNITYIVPIVALNKHINYFSMLVRKTIK